MHGIVATAQTDLPSDSLPSAEQRAFTEVLWAVSLNDEDLHETVLLLRQPNGPVWAQGQDIQRWRLRLPAVPPVFHHGEAYYALDGIKGLAYRVDETTQSIAIEAAVELFQPTTVSGTADSPSPVSPSFGGFLNYDGFAQYVQGTTQLNALAEVGTFNPWGVGTLTMLGQDLSGTARITRLDTTWTTDMPSRLTSLRVGDSISRPAGEWGGSVRFGGIQWATNFGIQPRFISFPLPTLSGESALPSTVDLYVNNALRLRQEVPAGPFSITDLPVVTGLGDARLVVKDLLGREQVITQPYYVSPRLLSQGLQDYSYEIGLVRENFGTTSFDYGRFFVAGTHRMGLTEQFTGEIHGELLKQQQTLGVTGSVLWPKLGVLSLSLAGSLRGGEAGSLVAFSFERHARWLSLGGRTQFTSERFTQLGLEPEQPAPRQTSQVFITLSPSDYGSLNLSYIRQANRDRPDIDVVNVGYNVTLGSLGYLSLAFFRSLTGDPNPTVGLTFTCTLGERRSVSLGGTLQRDNDRAMLHVQQNLPRGSGYGYRLLASGGTTEQLEAGLSLQNDVGLYTVEASRFDDQIGVRGSVSGGLAFLGGRSFFARRLTNSFALVQVPDWPNVRVYADNQLVGRTDAQGDVLIPQLRAYDRNPIRIEQADLPLDAQIDTFELDAVPYFRSGYLLTFPVKRSRGALFRITLATGDPMPAGAVVQIIGQTEEFPVALNGQVYVTGLDAKNRLRATWQGQSCEIELAFPETREPVPDLGTFTCRGVTS